MRNGYKMFIRKPKTKRPPLRPRRRWEDSFRMDVREIMWEGVEWIHVAQAIDQ
jgi:hypothetical protein